MTPVLGSLPVLRPGRTVLRRDTATLQVGIGAQPVRLPDTPAVAALLHALDPLDPGGADAVDLTEPDVQRALQRLDEAGHLAPSPGSPPAAPPGRVALTVRDAELLDRIGSLLTTAGLEADDGAEVALVVTVGPIPRATTDVLLQAGRPHLVASLVEGAWRVGPFVVPGLTACLRCVDAHESGPDPRRALMIEQAARAAVAHPEPLDPVTTWLAVAWAVQDLRTYLGGGEPATWSTTVDLPAPGTAAGSPVLTSWLRHPECGCAWDVLLELP